MIINSRILRPAMFGNGGYLDDDGRVWTFSPPEDVYLSFAEEGYLVCGGDQLRARDLIIIPRVFPGYIPLQFIKQTWSRFYECFEEYDLVRYKDCSFPVYFNDATEEMLEFAGPMVSRVILMLEQVGDMNDEDESFIEQIYNEIEYEEEKRIMKSWCDENAFQVDFQ